MSRRLSSYGPCRNVTSISPATQLLGEVVVEVVLDERDRQVRGDDPHLADQLGQELDGHALVGADAQPSGGAGGEVAELGLGQLESLGHRVRVPEQQSTRGGQRDRPRPAGPVEERLADGSLQAGDLLADGRLRVAQDVGCADEGPLLGHRAQCPKVPQLHVLEWHKHKYR